ncbi:MAG: PAS domain-containing protein [Candidatus Thorarchaeota archaeon]|nr:PAS domain-containing protein [Candidatus Thorarchaeota archaeon]
MFSEKKPLYMTIVAIISLWFIESVVDYFLVYDKTFLEVFAFNLPPHELWMRLVTLSVLIITGLTLSAMTDKLKIAHQKAESDREFLVAVMDSMKHPFYVIDPSNYNILKANKAAIGELPLDGNKCYEVTHGRSQPCKQPYHECPIQRVQETGEPIVIHHLHQDRQGQSRLIEVRAHPIKGPEGEIFAVAENMIDVTDVHRVKQALQISSDYSLFYMDLLTHDFRNKLQSTLLLTELVEESTDNPRIVRAARRTLNQLEDMRDMISKLTLTKSLGPAPIKEVSLTDAIDWSVEKLGKKYQNFEIFSNIENEEAIILADQHMKYLVFNLLENAVEHNPKPNKRIWLHLAEKETGYELSIADNGPGIDDKRKDELLNPNRRFGGVGLHQAQHIARKYGATLEISNRVKDMPHQGAELKVFFPHEPTPKASPTNLYFPL